MEKFNPKIGMVTNDCYLHGIGRNQDICCRGTIEFVGKDYFILRNESRDYPTLVNKEQYWVIEPQDFS